MNQLVVSNGTSAAGGSLLDRAIGYLAPERALKRHQARARMARITQTRAIYEAASLGRRTQGWRLVGTDANAENRMAIIRLREAARDMVRNNAFASRAKTSIAHNVVGAGIIPTVRARTEGRAQQVQELLRRHFETADIDADGRLNLYGLQSLAIQTIVESGEVLIRKRPRRATDNYALPFQLQVLEPDFLDTTVEGDLPNGNYAIQGVEFDLRGRRVAYYLFDRHPGALGLGPRLSIRGQRVSADFVAHGFRVDRPGQVRGISWFAPVMIRMRDFADYCDAQLLRQKIAACYAAFVTTDDSYSGYNPDGTPADISPTGFEVEMFEPGMIARLRPGEQISFAQPPTTQDFGAYSNATLHEIAAGLNIPYEAFTGDLSGVNYSSGRMGWLEFQRSIDSWRWNMVVPQICDPIANWTLEAASIVTGSTEPFWFDWTPPAREMIDPQTEIQAARDAIRSGLSTRSEEVRKRGLDPKLLDQEMADDNKRADRLGLTLDSDPRQITLRGVKQKSAGGQGDSAADPNDNLP